MLILAIDTSLSACSAAVLDTGGGVDRAVERSETMARGHAEALMPLIGDLLAATGLALNEMDRFAVTVGPGTFTGVRVGVAAARGFGLATGRPAVGIPTLEALAETARMAGVAGRPLLVAMDARRSEVYAQSFDAAGKPLGPATVASLAATAEALPGEITAVLGTAAAAIAQEADRHGRRLEIVGTAEAPRPAAVARLGLAANTAARPVPLYLRAPDARPQDGTAIVRR